MSDLDTPSSDPFAALDGPSSDPFSALDTPKPGSGGLLTSIGHGLKTAAEAIPHMVGGLISDGVNALLTPVQGEDEPAGSRAGINPLRGQKVTTQNTPGAQTPAQFKDAAENTLVNAALAVPASGLARPLVNAGVGAYYDKGHRLRGALVGGIGGELLHRGSEALADKLTPEVIAPPSSDLPPSSPIPDSSPFVPDELNASNRQATVDSRQALTDRIDAQAEADAIAKANDLKWSALDDPMEVNGQPAPETGIVNGKAPAPAKGLVVDAASKPRAGAPLVTTAADDVDMAARDELNRPTSPVSVKVSKADIQPLLDEFTETQKPTSPLTLEPGDRALVAKAPLSADDRIAQAAWQAPTVEDVNDRLAALAATAPDMARTAAGILLDPRAGAVRLRVLTGLLGGTVGAVSGAVSSPDDKVEGGVAGGLLGLAGGLLGGKAVEDRGNALSPDEVARATAEQNLIAHPGMTRNGTGYEQAMTKGTIGTPKADPNIPSMAGMDNGTSMVTDAIQHNAQTNTYRVAIPDALTGKIAQTVNVPALVAGSRTAMTAPEIQAIANHIATTRDNLVGLAQQSMAETDPAKKFALDAQFNAQMDALGGLTQKGTQAISESGRSLRAAQMMAANVQDPTFWSYTIQKNLKLPQGMVLPTDVQARLNDIIRNGVDETGSLTTDAQRQLLDLVRQNQPSTTLQKLSTLAKAGMIDNPALLGVMAVSHSLVGAADQLVVHPLAAALDQAFSAHPQTAMNTGEIGVYGKTLVTRLAEESGLGAAKAAFHDSDNLVDGMMKAGPAMWQRLTDAVGDTSPLAALEKPYTNFGSSAIGNLAQGWVGLVQGLHRVVYSPFQEATMAASLHGRAFRRALDEGLQRNTPELAARVADLTGAGANPVDMAEALADGARAVFQEQNAANDAITRGASGSELAKAAQEAFMPFTKVPTNIIKQSLVDYNPVGGLIQSAHAAMNGNQRTAYQALVRAGLLGSAAMYLGKVADDNGLVSPPSGGNTNTDAVMKQSNLPVNGGRLPGSNTSWNLARLGPLGVQVLLGAMVNQAFKKSQGKPIGEQAGNMASALVGGGVQVAADMPFLRGAKQVSDLVDPKSGSKTATRIAGDIMERFIPGGAATAAVARGMDPVAQHEKSGFLDELKDRIPLVRNTLPPAKSPLGDVTPNDRGVASQLFTPFSPTTERTDPVTQEALRLGVGFEGVRQMNRKDVNGLPRRETPEEFDQRRTAEDAGTRAALTRMIGLPNYQSLSKPEQQELFRQVEQKVRSAERANVLASQGSP